MTATKRGRISDLLDTPSLVVAFLNDAMASGDAAEIAAALGHIAKSTVGMKLLAEETGLGRETLYRVLSTEGNPTLETLLKVCKALNVKLSLEPAA